MPREEADGRQKVTMPDEYLPNQQISCHRNGSDSGHNSPGHLSDDDESVPNVGPRKNNETKINCNSCTQHNDDCSNAMSAVNKPFLGGYRHKLTSLIYHHASTQTERTMRKILIDKTCRSTQTSKVRHGGQQTASNKSCQTKRPGIYLSTRNDITVTATSYQSLNRIAQQVVTIQTYWRGFLARKIRWRMLQEKSQSESRNEAARRPLEDAFPVALFNETLRSKEDFERIYTRLDEWKHQRMSQINLDGQSKRPVLLEIVKKEAQILALVENQRTCRSQERRNRSTFKMLKQMTMPKLWHGTDGHTIQVITPTICKLGRLRELYCALAKSQSDYVTGDRLEVLIQCKEFLDKEENSSEPQTKGELRRLLDREIELLARRASTSALSALRQRVKFLLLQYICITYFQENGILQPQENAFTESSAIAQCPSCRHYSPIKNFLSSAAVKLSAKCQACRALDNNARICKTNLIYQRHLKWIHTEEHKLGSSSGIAFILQEADLEYLIDKIWHRRSALSEVDDPQELVLCRWHPEEPWSPWNCVLLTENEAQIHRNMGSVEKNYGAIFVQKVKHRQTLAKRHYRQLPRFSKYFTRNVMPTTLTTSMFISVKPVNVIQDGEN